MRRLLVLGFCTAVLAGGAPMTAAARSVDAAMQQAIDRAMGRAFPALVRIHVLVEEASSGRMIRQQASGSGAIIDKEGHIITNHHVAGRARRLVCRMPDGEEIEAELIGTDPLADIAVLKLRLDRRKKTAPLPVAEFGDSDAVRVGDAVLAMGSPGGLSQSVTKGIVCNTAMIAPRMMADSFRLDGENTGSLVRWIAHDAPIYGGNSGGPLVNLDGRIIGINEIGVAGLGGAIPGNLARSIARQLIEFGDVRRSWTGLEGQPRPKSATAEKGLLIGGVIADSPAAAAGLKPGDLVVEFDGTPVDGRIPEDLPVFTALQLSTPVGKKVAVKVLREGAPVTCELVTRAREPAVGKDRELKEWGFTARDYTLMSALENKRPSSDGVLVSSVRAGGPAQTAEPSIDPGDALVEVGGRPVKKLADLETVTRELTAGRKEPRPVLAAFERGLTRYLTVCKIGGEPPKDEPAPSRKPDFPVVLQPLTPDLAEALELKGTNGVRIAYVVPGRSADKAGFKVGDLLVRFDGDPIRATRPEDVTLLMAQVRQYKIGADIEFDVLRDRRPMKLALKLEESADTAEEPARHADKDFELTVRALTMSDRIARQIPETLRGVLIERIEPGSWMALAQARTDDILLTVDGRPTPDVDAVETLFKDAVARKAPHLVLFVQRGIHTMFLEVEPNWNGATPKPAETEKK